MNNLTFKVSGFVDVKLQIDFQAEGDLNAFDNFLAGQNYLDEAIIIRSSTCVEIDSIDIVSCFRHSNQDIIFYFIHKGNHYEYCYHRSIKGNWS